jgi:hypothetical protein
MTDYEKDLRCQAAIDEIRAEVPPFRTWGDVERLMKRAFAEGWNGCIESIEEELEANER